MISIFDKWLQLTKAHLSFFLHLRVKCQCALPDLNRELQISVGTAGPQPQAPNRKLQSSEWSRCGEPITANLYWDGIVLNMTTKGGFVWNGQHAHIQVNRYQSPLIFVQHQFRTPITKKENKLRYNAWFCKFFLARTWRRKIFIALVVQLVFDNVPTPLVCLQCWLAEETETWQWHVQVPSPDKGINAYKIDVHILWSALVSLFAMLEKIQYVFRAQVAKMFWILKIFC